MFTASPSRPDAIGRRGMVATSQPLAAIAGIRALEGGGNAVDAALAAAGVLAVTEPNQCGPGGDLFAIVVRDGDEPAALNASGRAPADPGDALPELFGPRSVTVPGCVDGWRALAERFSRHGHRACAGAGRRAGPRRLRPAAQGAQLLDGRLARSVRRRRRAVPR